MNGNLSELPVFFLIIVSASKEGQLNKVEMRLPDKNGKIVEKELIYERAKLVEMSA